MQLNGLDLENTMYTVGNRAVYIQWTGMLDSPLNRELIIILLFVTYLYSA